MTPIRADNKDEVNLHIRVHLQCKHLRSTRRAKILGRLDYPRMAWGVPFLVAHNVLDVAIGRGIAVPMKHGFTPTTVRNSKVTHMNHRDTAAKETRNTILSKLARLPAAQLSKRIPLSLCGSKLLVLAVGRA